MQALHVLCKQPLPLAFGAVLGSYSNATEPIIPPPSYSYATMYTNGAAAIISSVGQMSRYLRGACIVCKSTTLPLFDGAAASTPLLVHRCMRCGNWPWSGSVHNENAGTVARDVDEKQVCCIIHHCTKRQYDMKLFFSSIYEHEYLHFLGLVGGPGCLQAPAAVDVGLGSGRERSATQAD